MGTMVIASIYRKEYKLKNSRRCTICKGRIGDIVYIPYYELRIKRRFFDVLNLIRTRRFCGECANNLTEKDSHTIYHDMPFTKGGWI